MCALSAKFGTSSSTTTCCTLDLGGDHAPVFAQWQPRGDCNRHGCTQYTSTQVYRSCGEHAINLHGPVRSCTVQHTTGQPFSVVSIQYTDPHGTRRPPLGRAVSSTWDCPHRRLQARQAHREACASPVPSCTHPRKVQALRHPLAAFVHSCLSLLPLHGPPVAP